MIFLYSQNHISLHCIYNHFNDSHYPLLHFNGNPSIPPTTPRRLDVQHIQFSTGEAVDQARFQCQLSQVDCHDGGRVGHGQEDLRSTSGPPRQLVCSLQPPIN